MGGKINFKEELTKISLSPEIIADSPDNVEEPEDAYIHFVVLELYGTDNANNKIKIGEVRGFLVLLGEIFLDGWNPITVCDECSADLTCAVITLADIIERNPLQNLFYMLDLDIKPEFNNMELKEVILQSLGNLLNYYGGLEVNILAYIPSPLVTVPNPEMIRYNILLWIREQQLKNEPDQGNVVSFAKRYRFSDEDIDILFNPAFYKLTQDQNQRNNEAYDLFTKNGYVELDNGLLYKQEIEVDELGTTKLFMR